jgi:aspartyl-tRNA(Asn)/glutamyl-tRNA(Gln) amidotransferase subunit A
MSKPLSPLAQLRVDLETHSPREIAAAALEKANSNASRNVFLSMDAERTLAEAEALPARFPDPAKRPLLYGVPVAVKDCFDMAGFPTSCGSRFYAEKNGIAREDSAVVARLRQMGAIITGKTHMHPLAYGITGENAEYGDCLQPADATLLTGGSSSGSAASVQEGSSIAAIGTDTGGSIRAPAAFCNLAGYRATVGLGDWRGGAHLAQSFDTLGWLFRDLRDGPVLAAALLDVPMVAANPAVRVGVVAGAFLDECEPEVLDSYRMWQQRLRSAGAELRSVEPDFWHDAFEIYAGIQASEAAKIHNGNFDHFETVIADRLRWGASLPSETVDALRERHKVFRSRVDALLDGGYLILPCAQMGRLIAGADHSNTRQTILRYTTPISLAGMPVVTLPGDGGGVQLVAPRGRDAELLAFAAKLPLKPSA